MKLILINNDSDSWEELCRLAVESGHDVTTFDCHDIPPIATLECDAIVLSGGMWYDNELEHQAVYARELDLLRNAPAPILGICLGMQLMQQAYGGLIPVLDRPQAGIQIVELSENGQTALPHFEKVLNVQQNHTRGILELVPDFEALARSTSCVEIIRHRHKPLLGIQFHPELDANNGSRVFEALLAVLVGEPAFDEAAALNAAPLLDLAA